MKSLWKHIYKCPICKKKYGSDWAKVTPCHKCSMSLEGKKAREENNKD